MDNPDACIRTELKHSNPSVFIPLRKQKLIAVETDGSSTVWIKLVDSGLQIFSALAENQDDKTIVTLY